MHRIDGAKAGVKRGGFAGAGWAGHQHDAVRLQDDLAQGLFVLGGKTQLVQGEKNLPARQQAQRNAFAVNGRHCRNADVDFLALDADVDASVLRQAFLGNVHSRHDLHAGDERRLITLELRRHRRLVQNAVDAVADAQFVFRRLEVNVRGAVFVGLPDDLIDELDDARLLVAFGDFLVLAHQQFDRFVLGQFIERFGADPVILFHRLLNFVLGRHGNLNGALGVELDRIQHRGVQGVADGDLQRAVFKLDREHEKLESDFSGNLLPGFGRDR